MTTGTWSDSTPVKADEFNGRLYGYYPSETLSTHTISYSRYCENPKKQPMPFEIKKVIFNDPATIVLWEDGTKTVVKCGNDDIFDPEKGLAMAIVKKALGNKGNYFNTIKKWLPEEPRVMRTVLSKFSEATLGLNKEDDLNA